MRTTNIHKRTGRNVKLLRGLRTVASIYDDDEIFSSCTEIVAAHDRHFVTLRRDVQRIVDRNEVKEAERVEITSRLYDLAFEIHALKKLVGESTAAFKRQTVSIFTLETQMAAISSAVSALMEKLDPVDPDDYIDYVQTIGDDDESTDPYGR